MRRSEFRRGIAAAFALALAIVLAGLAGAWRVPALAQSDLRLSLWAQSLRSPALDATMATLTLAGSGPALAAAALLAAALFWRDGRRREAGALAASLLAMPLNLLLKLVAHRPRPLDPVAVLTATAGTSFPSGHAMDAAAVYGTLAALVWSRHGRKGPTVGLILVPLGVGVSRVFLGAHWGYDVVAGWAAGALCVAGILGWLPSRSPHLPRPDEPLGEAELTEPPS